MSDKVFYFISKIIRKLSVLLFILSIMIFLTYLVGNYQYFLDFTQLILLKMFKVVSLVFIITGFYYIVLLVSKFKKNIRKNIINLGLLIIAEIIIVILYILTNTIIVVTQTVN